MSTTAKFIELTAKTASEAMNESERLGGRADQGWEKEITFYTFDDKSVLFVAGSEFGSCEDSADDPADE